MRVTSNSPDSRPEQDAVDPADPDTFEMEDSTVLPEVDEPLVNDTHPKTVANGLARHTLGLLLLLTVVFLWTASNFLGSSIFADKTYAKPFFLTYLNSSTFILCLLPACINASPRLLKDAVRSRRIRPRQRETDEEIDAFIKPSDDLADQETAKPTHLTVAETTRLAIWFCPLWFGANYFAMSCLQYTTVASATILTSTSSMWTLLLGAVSGTEKFTWRKFGAVVASLIGIALISQVDLKADPPADIPERPLDAFPDKSAYEMLLGDALALLSAIIYGFYTISLKKTTLAVEPRSLHMPTFFGLAGLFNTVLLLPALPVLNYTGIEHFLLPPTGRIWTILLVNSLSSLLSDIAWAYAMVLTSPLVVTVGLSLTIPLSLVGEMIIQGRFESWIYWVGATIVVASFIFVERDEKLEEDAAERARIDHPTNPSAEQLSLLLDDDAQDIPVENLDR